MTVGNGNNSVTLADVAKRVGVSARTVSRVVNNEGGFTPETRERVLEAIAELGYRPNLMARGLIRRRSDTIGFIATDLQDPFFPGIAASVERSAERLGKVLLLAANDNDRERQARSLEAFRGLGVDGVILFPGRDSLDDLAAFAGDGLPLVVVNSEIESAGLISVGAEIQHGAEMAVGHLAEGGRTRIALLIDSSVGGRDRPGRREAGYRTALRRHGLPIDDNLIVRVDNSISGGIEGGLKMLSMSERPDAIFAYNDLMAVGALRALISRGVRLPDDIALIGFDDIDLCEAATPSLSSVRIDRDLLGQKAVQALMDLLETPNAVHPPRRLPVELVIRESA